MTRTTTAFCWTLLLALACACEPEPDPGSARQELEQGLQLSNLVALVVRASTLSFPTPDWSSTQAVEQSIRDHLKSSFAGSTCPTVLEVGKTLRFTCDDCDYKTAIPGFSLRLNGVVEGEANGEVSASPTRVEVVFRTQGITVTRGRPYHPYLVAGTHHSTRHKSDPARLDIESQAKIRRLEGEPHELRVYLAGSASRSGICTTLDGLGYHEAESRLVLSPKGLRYCTKICPESGNLAIAGQHLQRLRFINRSATLSLNEGPYAPVQPELPCGLLFP